MLPYLDPRIRWVGPAYLRVLNETALKKLKNLFVIQTLKDGPIAVLIPYKEFLRMQEAARRWEGGEVHSEGDEGDDEDSTSDSGRNSVGMAHLPDLLGRDLTEREEGER